MNERCEVCGCPSIAPCWGHPLCAGCWAMWAEATEVGELLGELNARLQRLKPAPAGELAPIDRFTVQAARGELQTLIDRLVESWRAQVVA